MFSLKKPAPEEIERYLDSQAGKPLSYAGVGITRKVDGILPRFIRDHNRVLLGNGRETFEQAKKAVRSWQMLRFEWLEFQRPDAAIEVGTTVAILIRRFGIWSLNPTRIIYVLDEDGSTERYGFAYGTLADHVERGEERFMVEWHHADDAVYYDLLAFSQPNKTVAWLSFPYVRALQKRFARDSKVAMARFVRDSKSRD